MVSMKFEQMVLDMTFDSMLVCVALVYIADLSFAIYSASRK